MLNLTVSFLLAVELTVIDFERYAAPIVAILFSLYWLFTNFKVSDDFPTADSIYQQQMFINVLNQTFLMEYSIR